MRRSVDDLKCLWFFVFFFRFTYFYFMGMSIHLHGVLCILCMQFPQRPEGGVLDSLEPELQTLVSSHAGAGNPSWVGPLSSLQAYGEN